MMLIGAEMKYFTIAILLFARGIESFSLYPRSAYPDHFKNDVKSTPPRTASLSMSIPNAIDTATSGFSSIARLPFGTIVQDTLVNSGKNFRIKALYDVEQSKDCRQVRERITELDLKVDLIIPSAPNSRAINDESYKYFLKADGEKKIPTMVVMNDDDDDTEIVLAGVDNIIGFFDNTYGVRKPIIDDVDEIKTKVAEFLVQVGSYLPQILRFGRGENKAGCAFSSVDMEKPLVLYSYEGNQFCRLVREVLTELDLPYELCSAGKGSTRRAELASITGGSTQCPFLMDPNKSVEISESEDIIKYLYKNYAQYTPPTELLGQVSANIMPILKPLFQTLAPLQAGSSSDDTKNYENELLSAKEEIQKEIESDNVVVYTYSLSPFCTEALAVLDNLDVQYKEISLGAEWVPFLINEGGAQKRMALLEMTGQSSLPHIFVNSQSIGGLFEGLIPALENGKFLSLTK